ncbi:MAG: carbohydrate ABC transporter permease [Chordicoccus sp.]
MKIQQKKRIGKMSVGSRTFSVINYVFFGILTVICFYPFYYLIINSISANDLASSGKIMWRAVKIHFDNYKQVLQLSGFARALLVSVARTVIGTVCTVMASAYLGFMFTQKRLWKRKLWYRMIVITMYFNAGIIPMYITMQTLHLTNNFLVYILPSIVAPFNIILVKTYIESIPESLQEAAELDGASVYQVFWKIVLPISKPILSTCAIFSAVGQWNSFQDTLVYITDAKLYSLQYLLYTYTNQANSIASMAKNGATGALANAATQLTASSVRVTVAVVVVLPILFVYPFFQKYFVKGMMIGSVKG